MQFDNKPKLILSKVIMLEGEEERKRAYIERMQKKLLMQAMVCGQYFHILAEAKSAILPGPCAGVAAAADIKRRRLSADANADLVDGDDGDDGDDAADARDTDEHALDMFDELDLADPTKGRHIHAVADELAAVQGGYTIPDARSVSGQKSSPCTKRSSWTCDTGMPPTTFCRARM